MRYILFFVTLLFVTLANAQMDLNLGIHSKYMWRGIELGRTPVVQPELTYDLAPFTIGVFGSYAIDRNAAVYDKIDMYLKFYNETKLGKFSLTARDYYLVEFPAYKNSFTNYNNWNDSNGPGAHLIEVYAEYSGYNFDGLIGVNVWNDQANTIYMEAGYTFGDAAEYKLSRGTLVRLFIGATPGSEKPGPQIYSYQTSSFAIVNVGVTAQKMLSNIPVYASFVVNPRIEQAYLVFGIYL